MHLLLVTGSFPERSETFIYRKCVALANRGHHVTVATRQRGDWSAYPAPLPPTLRVEQMPPDGSLRVPSRALSALSGAARVALTAPAEARDLYELCHRHATTARETSLQFLRYVPFVARRADIVHFEFLSLGAMYPLAGEVVGAPVIVSCRGSDVNTLELLPASLREQTLECLRRAAAIHCVSAHLAAEVTRLTGRRDGLWVNRPAVDTDRIAVRPPPARSGAIHLLATGRLVWKKGFEYLLEALARLARRGVDFHAEIVGDGELRSSLRYSIGDLGLERQVTLVGSISPSEVLTRLQSTDVFVLSSVAEGISNAVLEAMASGVPIVTTTAGGMTEAITDGVEGFVVPVRDAARLADRIEQLAQDRELRIAMGTAARARAEAEFSITRQVETFEAMYRSVTGHRS